MEKGFCMVCGQKSWETDSVNRNSFQNIVTNGIKTEESNTLVTLKLQSILFVEMPTKTNYSELLCSRCLKLVNEYDMLQIKLNKTKSIIVELFSDSVGKEHSKEYDATVKNSDINSVCKDTACQLNMQIASNSAIKYEKEEETSVEELNMYTGIIIPSYDKTELEVTSKVALGASSLPEEITVCSVNKESGEKNQLEGGSYEGNMYDICDISSRNSSTVHQNEAFIIPSQDGSVPNSTTGRCSCVRSGEPKRSSSSSCSFENMSHPCSFTVCVDNSVEDNKDNPESLEKRQLTNNQTLYEPEGINDVWTKFDSMTAMSVPESVISENSIPIAFPQKKRKYSSVTMFEKGHQDNPEYRKICNDIFKYEVFESEEHITEKGEELDESGDNVNSKAFPRRYNNEGHWCKFCVKVFPSSKKLKKHEAVHLKKLQLERRAEIGNEQSSENGQLTNTLSSLQLLEIIQNVGKSYSCRYCRNFFIDKEALEHHEKSHTSFSSLQLLELIQSEKLQAVKTRYRPFPCLNCGLLFEQKSQLYIHEKMHRKLYN